LKVNDDIKTVVVLGMHRSGTSLVAGILERLGVNMGKRQIGIHWSNPLGHYENVDFVKMDDMILNVAGGAWDDPPEISSILEVSSNEKLLRKIQEVVKKNEDRIWGWKVPTTSLTIELYLPFLRNPYFIICYRDPQEIVKSLQKRDGMDPRKARKLIEVYNESIKQFLNRHPNLKVMEIEYRSILANPKDAVQQIINFIGINPSQERVTNAIEFVLPREKIEQLQAELKRKEWMYLVIDTLRNPYIIRRYLYKALKNPSYTLKKLGLK